MQTSVLLSIKPEFVSKIFSGQKRYEFRRAIFKSASVSRVVVYASSPVQRVVGEFEIGEILQLCKCELWRRTEKHSGIEKHYFDEYFNGRTTGFAIRILSPHQYATPVRLSAFCNTDRPPQSFMYLED